mgnify:FL=1
MESAPTAFYSYDEYLTAVDTLYQVVKLRGESIQGQLDGTIPSTESTQRSSDALVDASTLDISVMGSMNTGGGGGGFGFNAPTNSENTSDTPDAAQDTSETQTAPDASAESENTPSSDFDPSQFGGKMPDGSDASQFGGEPPSGVDFSQFAGGSQDASDNTQQTDENAQNGGNGNSAGRPSMGNFPGSSGGTSAAASTENLILYGVSLLIFAAAMLFAGLYRRRPRKR